MAMPQRTQKKAAAIDTLAGKAKMPVVRGAATAKPAATGGGRTGIVKPSLPKPVKSAKGPAIPVPKTPKPRMRTGKK